MTRMFIVALVLAFGACRADAEPIQSAPASTLFRGAGSEVRLRCGSETLRAKLRQGRIVAQVGNGKNAVLTPVDDKRAKSGPAYSDGKLTLYKAPEAETWTLAKGDTAAMECRPEVHSN